MTAGAKGGPVNLLDLDLAGLEFEPYPPALITFNAGIGPDGKPGPEIKIKAGGEFSIDGRVVETDEGQRDALVYFANWARGIKL